MLGFVKVMIVRMMLISDIIVTSGQFLLDFSAGVENVKVTEIQNRNVTLIFNTSEMAPVRKVTLLAAENGAIVSLTCSPEEKMSGCEDVTSPRVFVYIGHENVSVVFRNFTARDAGGYTSYFVGNEVKNKSFNLTNESLKINSSTETPPLTTDSDSRNTVLIVLSVVGVVVVVVVVVLAVIWIYLKFKKKRHSSVPTSDCEKGATDFIATTTV